MGRKIILTGVVILFLVLISIPVLWISGNQNPIHTGHISPNTGDPVRLNYLPGEIPLEINQTITETTRNLDDLTAIPDSSRTVTNTDIRLDTILADFDEKTLKYSLVADITSNSAVKEDAESASFKRDEFLNSVYLREDIAHALSMVTPDQKHDQELHKRLTDDFRLAFLPIEVKSEMNILGKNLSERCSVYYANQQDGNVTLNLQLIPDIVRLRNQITALIGYPSFTDYQIAQSGIPIDRTKLLLFLTNKSGPFNQASHIEAAELLNEKKKNDPGATVVYDYEIQLLRSTHQINRSAAFCSTAVHADIVVERLNGLVADLFGISITSVSSSAPSDIHLYKITDPGSSNTQAWFYLWIKSDPGAGSTTGKTYYLRAGHESNGAWVPPVSALVISVPGPQNIDQISLSPVDIQVLFHEYGHLLRHSLATGRYAALSSGARDSGGFSEIFSLFFEKLLWTPEVLDRIFATINTPKGQSSSIHNQILACHGEDAGWGPGYISVYPYFLSLLDIEIHSENGTPDFINLYNSLYENMTGYQASSAPSSLILNPAFFVSDNAGIYWHYVYDEVCANNIFSRFQGEGVLNQSNGIALRKQLFETAGTVNLSSLITEYLGTSDLSRLCS
ncbi:M3 family metallopeptidase [Methanospirillum lacunae]|uniref:Peptidase M3A/M3B catalytic domain-containing protein n=1 Tax=Methanospirillum lacunae TaxID=668570 RepID=A0A2V2NAQ3_9EURY|nr:M3 family metallopeptidase [Methanospirillum lacunae]PWR72641.1 hypothetical protein DK846_06655 [Methanospirillum lacunae]